jgi:hypothetical protein
MILNIVNDVNIYRRSPRDERQVVEAADGSGYSYVFFEQDFGRMLPAVMIGLDHNPGGAGIRFVVVFDGDS